MAEEEDINYDEMDFDEESPQKPIVRQGSPEDDQKRQKQNGEADSLRSRIDELESQLKAANASLKTEKNAHASTQRELKSALESVEQGGGGSSAPQSRSGTAQTTSGEDSGVLDMLRSLAQKYFDDLQQNAEKHWAGFESKLDDPGAMTPDAYGCILNGFSIIYGKGKKKTISMEADIRGLKADLKTFEKSDFAKVKADLDKAKDELLMSHKAAEDIKALKDKMLGLVDRLRLEKERNLRQNMENETSKKKVAMLTDHIEKLMTHLKHEATSKIRAMEQLRKAEKETLRMKQKASLINRKSMAKDRFLIELREGSKILEDQLRLMDEKYLELRGKLDWARENGARRVKKAERMAADLRVKYALAGGTGSLDGLPLPDIYGGSTTTDGGGSREFGNESALGFGNSMSGSSVASTTARSKKGSKKGARTGSAPGKGEPNIDDVIEKIRLKTGGQPEWTEERLKNLTAPR